ncbi:Terminase small subunit [Aminobacter sp. MSH1]|uniref:terminase small subunit n=1 Tax=Aminobacter sp. MSH1 TaxID=374606 RepID=UPI000D3D8A08|nr:terminase small subunit [Aminobacter sp. MSH1]AWC21391.1 Terminase small subunit [Aminobacter sp. MSH1]
MSELTAKQARFVEEYVLDLNATQAAIRAGYAEKSASVEGARLLANAKVGEAVAAGLKARSERTKIDADWVLTRLAEEAEADLSDLYDDNGHLKPMKEWPKIWRKGLVAGIETLTEFETVDGKKEPVGVVRKIRLSDRIKRVELIGKHVDVQAFRERVAHENPDGTPLADTSDRELAKAVAYVLSKGLKADG